jgi:hypothetical protein
VVPVSHHPIDAVNLTDPRMGLVDRVDALLAASGLEKGRVDISLGAAERNVGLTVNEYETMLMRHDLVEVLQDPLKFAAQRGRHMIDDPLSIPTKTLNYAKYDVPRLLNSLMEALRWDQSVLERAMAKLMSVPARRLLRSRRVTFLAAHDDATRPAPARAGPVPEPDPRAVAAGRGPGPDRRDPGRRPELSPLSPSRAGQPLQGGQEVGLLGEDRRPGGRGRRPTSARAGSGS